MVFLCYFTYFVCAADRILWWFVWFGIHHIPWNSADWVRVLCWHLYFFLCSFLQFLIFCGRVDRLWELRKYVVNLMVEWLDAQILIKIKSFFKEWIIQARQIHCGFVWLELNSEPNTISEFCIYTSVLIKKASLF